MKSDQLWSVTDIELLPLPPRVADRQHTVDLAPQPAPDPVSFLRRVPPIQHARKP